MTAADARRSNRERDRDEESRSPVDADEAARDPEGPEQLEGIGLCLSGGGYRAMLFHVGTLWRLNELGYLARVTRVSSVSGGSITAATLGMNWERLAFAADDVATQFQQVLVTPLRALAGRTIDVRSVLRGIFSPSTVSERVAATLRKQLFADATLQDLPEQPRFVINATNLQSGALWRFSKPYMADYRVGMALKPGVDLATAVAASAAFPPVLSPLRLSVDSRTFANSSGGELCRHPYTSEIVLSDGGVYDNLGLETAWKRCAMLLVSDGGGQLLPQEKIASDWPRHAIRVNGVIDHQVRNLRKRQLVAAFQRQDRAGAYWSIRTPIAKYGPLEGVLPCPASRTAELAAVPTRLQRMTGTLQERLINWGYAVCDAAMRRYVEPDASSPSGFPYGAAEV